MDHVVATLQTVQAEILATDDLDQAAPSRTTRSRARSRICASRSGSLSAGLEETFAETRGV